MNVKPFLALMPKKEYAQKCAALPYDVMSSAEAKEVAKANPLSFLRVDRGEINFDGVAFDDDKAYEAAASRLKELEDTGVYEAQATPSFYFYRQVMNGRAQTGIVGVASVDDYLSGKIKKHELTRADKEADRIRHVKTCSAQTGPIFLLYKDDEALQKLVEKETEKEPTFDFVSDDGVRQTVWKSSSAEIDEKIRLAFENIPALYIADGHHRAASAVRASLDKRAENPNYSGKEEFNYFLSVSFPASDLEILPYNRLLKTLGERTEEEFLQEIQNNLGEVQPVSERFLPNTPHTAGLYLGGKWYCVRFHERLCKATDPVARLDCEILQKNFLSPVLGINDPRTDKRIDFAGGIRGLAYLEERCKTDCVAAIAMCATSLQELIDVADGGGIMPPKSTWFEPKLLSGIFIHKI